MKARTSLEVLEGRIAPATLYAVTASNTILVFDSATPGTVIDTLAITGLGAGEIVTGIDFRPGGGELIASTAAASLMTNSFVRTYVIDTDTGTATFIGATAAALPGWGDVAGGFDFNPTVDRIRIVNTNNENARINPNNGLLAGDDTNLTFMAPATGPIVGVAYDRNFVHGVSVETSLYGIDTGANRLVLIGGLDGSPGPGPNGGSVTSVGQLGVTLDPNFDGGFDIENSSGTAFAALRDDNTNVTGLYTIDLVSGAATFVGTIDNGAVNIRGLSVSLPTVNRVNATTATWLDVDGDRVTLKTTRGTLDDATLRLNAGPNGGGQLKLIDFNGDTDFQGTGLKLTVKKAPGGDGRTHVGSIDATGIDLGAIRVPGDLGNIEAGDATTATAAVRSLAVQSLGAFSTATGALELESNLTSALGKLTVKTDVRNIFLNIAGGDDGTIDSLKIGGSLIGGAGTNSGRIDTAGDIDSVKIGGDILGGSANGSGFFGSNGALRSLTLGGSLVGGPLAGSGLIEVSDDITQLKIAGDIVGASGTSTGRIDVTGKIFDGKIGGSVLGGSGPSSGAVSADAGINRLTLGGSLYGGEGSNSGRISSSAGDLGTLKLGGDVRGGSGSSTGVVSATGFLRNLTLGGNLVGGDLPVGATGDLNSSGAITAGQITKVTILGNVITGFDNSATFRLGHNASIGADNDIGSLTIRGDVLGRTGTGGATFAQIFARGQVTPGATTDVAIAKVTIGGNVEQANILGGYNTAVTASNADAQIGKVTVGGDWVASNLVAGVRDDNDNALDVFFGDADDEVIPGGMAGITSRIGAIVIKGSVIGTVGTLDRFGFVAQEIGSFKFGPNKLPLTPGLDGPIPLGLPTGDVVVKEI